MYTYVFSLYHVIICFNGFDTIYLDSLRLDQVAMITYNAHYGLLTYTGSPGNCNEIRFMDCCESYVV